MQVDVLGGELVEVFEAAVVGVDDFGGHVAGAGGAVEGHHHTGIVLIGVAVDVLAGGAGHEQFAAGSQASTRTVLGWLMQYAVGNDLGFEAGGAEHLRDVFGGLAVFRSGGEVGLGGEGFEVLAGEFGIGDGEELLFDVGLGGEVARSRRRRVRERIGLKEGWMRERREAGWAAGCGWAFVGLFQVV